jgi:N-acetylglutamate synthase
MKGGLVVRITPADVGSRVSVRSRLDAGEGEPATTDTVGWLRAWDGGELRIERRDGSVATLNAADLLAGKVLPHPPPERRSR